MVNYQNQTISSQSDKGLDRYEYLGRDTVSAYKLKSTPTWKISAISWMRCTFVWGFIWKIHDPKDILKDLY